MVANLDLMVKFNKEAIPKSDIKSVIKFDISIKLTTWIGHKFILQLRLIESLTGLVFIALQGTERAFQHYRDGRRNMIPIFSCFAGLTDWLFM